jgi:hypothetical protein
MNDQLDSLIAQYVMDWKLVKGLVSVNRLTFSLSKGGSEIAVPPDLYASIKKMNFPQNCPFDYVKVPKYSTRLKDAIVVLETFLLENNLDSNIEIFRTDMGLKYVVNISEFGSDDVPISEIGDNLATAICKCIVKVVNGVIDEINDIR